MPTCRGQVKSALGKQPFISLEVALKGSLKFHIGNGFIWNICYKERINLHKNDDI